MAITDKQRTEAETLIYSVMDALDNTNTNSDHYKGIFTKMSNTQFETLFKKKFPLKFHVNPFVIEPKIEDIEAAANILNIPLFEKVRLPHVYRNKDGIAVQSKECMVGYLHVRKEQQLITKKNSMSTNITQRDMKTGRLLGYDKNGNTSDRENEALLVGGLYNTLDELKAPRADYMNAKNSMYAAISATGMVTKKDVPVDSEDSLSLNLLNTYLIGSHIQSNIINKDYYLPHTLNNRKKVVDRV